jgi:hypothetical protein
MSGRSTSAPGQVSRGCLLALAVPLVLMGIGMLSSALGAIRTGDFVRAYWNGVGALLSLGVPVATLVARRRPVSAPVTGHTPFGCYAIMGGAFLLLGAGMLLSSLRGFLLDDGNEALGYGIVAAALLGLGSWILIGGRVVSRRVAPLVDALRRNDPEPWRHVRDWTDGKARDAGNARVLEAVVLAVVANALAWPMAWAALSNPSDSPARFVFMALPLAGIWTALRALRAVRHRRLHGETIFNMDTFPGVVGESLAGTVLIRIDPGLTRQVVFTVTLTCRRRIERRSRSPGDGVSTQQLWREQQQVAATAYRSELGTHLAFPIAFAIPLEAEPTTLVEPDDRVLWHLAIDADLGALPFHAEMEVPVFDLRDEKVRAQEIPDLSASLPASLPTPAQVAWTPGPFGGADPAAGAVHGDGAPSIWRRIFPEPVARFAIDEDRSGRVHVESETGDAARAQAGFLLSLAGALGLLLVLRSPALQEVNGLGLIPVAALFGGSFLWLFYYRYTKAELTLSTYDVTLRNRKVPHGQVMLQYAELERAEIAEVGGRTTTKNRNVVHSVVEHDVRIVGRNGRSWAAGLRVTDKQQAQWVVGHLNRRIAASGSTTAQ